MKYSLFIIFAILAPIFAEQVADQSAAPAEDKVKSKRGIYGGLGYGYAAPAVSYAAPVVYRAPAVAYAAPLASTYVSHVAHVQPVVRYSAPVVKYAAPVAYHAPLAYHGSYYHH